MTSPDPPRLRPDVDLLCTTLLAARLPAFVGTELPAPRDSRDLIDDLPAVTVRMVSPGSFPQSRNLRRQWAAGIDVQCWAMDRRDTSDLDDLALRVLAEAQEHATPAAGVQIARFEVDVPGHEVLDPSRTPPPYRWQASYSLLLRPA